MEIDQILAVVQDVLQTTEPVLVEHRVTLDELHAEVERLTAAGSPVRAHVYGGFAVEDVTGGRLLTLSREDLRILGKTYPMRMVRLGITDQYVPFRQVVAATERLRDDLADAFALIERHDSLVGKVLLTAGGATELSTHSFWEPRTCLWGVPVSEVELPHGVRAVVVGEDAGSDKRGNFALVCATPA